MKKVQLKDNRTIKRYSESVKSKILKEISEGRITKQEAVRKYGISPSSIYYWMERYNRLDLYNPTVRIMKTNERDQLKKLQNKVKELEKALATTQLRHIRSEADLSLALEILGYKDKEEFEKKTKSNS